MDLLYIASPSYSGSTLLTLLLARYPQIATVGELKASAMGDVDQYQCSCSALIGRCEFWKELSEELERRGTPLRERQPVSPNSVNFGTHFRAPDWTLFDRVVRARVRGPWFEAMRVLALRVIPGAQRRFDSILEKNRRVCDALSALQHREVFLDSSKDPVRLRYLAASKLWRVRVIHLVRDGRATAASHKRHQATTMAASTLEWRRTHAECERLKELFGHDAWCQVHYEQLCRNPDETVDALCRFIGLTPSLPSSLDTLEHHILGNAMRLTTPLKIVRDESWRTILTPEDLAIFERLGGDTNRRYGYEA